MSTQADSVLTVAANTIQNETSIKANTATRVGNAINAIIDSKINNDKISTNVELGTSDILLPSQKAVKEYVDANSGIVGIETVTGFGVDNTDPLNPVVNKYESGNLTATGTNFISAEPIVTVYTRIIGGAVNTGVSLDDASLELGNTYTVINLTATNKIFYSNYVIVNGVIGTSVNLLPNIIYTLTWTTEGVSVNQEQIVSNKEYGAYVEQFSSNSPTVVSSSNDTGSNFSWTRVSQGRMRLTSSLPILLLDKINIEFCGNGGDIDSPLIFVVLRTDNNKIEIAAYDTVFTKQDSFNFYIKVKIKP